ncbi:MAG: hypothetical protein CW338_09325 [Clostridiales bacterium]|nr:hypothetical protein [Clostridiales bacterium]
MRTSKHLFSRPRGPLPHPHPPRCRRPCPRPNLPQLPRLSQPPRLCWRREWTVLPRRPRRSPDTGRNWRS